MRVIAGSAGGRRLKTVPGMSARPTSDRVREALFSILGERPSGARVLDLFAGAGTLGIESLSRGAARCVFVDTDRAACRVIRENLESLGFAGSALVLCRKASTVLRSPDSRVMQWGPFDLVFADPPYGLGVWGQLLEDEAMSPAISRDALIVVEHSSRTESAPVPDGMELIRQSTYGDTGISFYQFTR